MPAAEKALDADDDDDDDCDKLLQGIRQHLLSEMVSISFSVFSHMLQDF